MTQTCCSFCLLLLFHLHMILFNNQNQVKALDANTDREALLSFSTLLSDPQGALRGWNSSSSHCTWFGVTCSKTRVLSLRLRGLGLSGTLSPHLSNLSSLQGLDLRDNNFYGSIPLELGGLSSLGSIALGGNSFNGTVPPSLSDCHNLENITLEFNKLTGNIPYQLGLLPRLKLLDVSANNLTGRIPTSFGNLSFLSTLALARNQLFGEIPRELGNLQNLAFLQLSGNKLTGEIPSSLYNISSLVYLSLTENALSGTLPSHMGSGLPNLREVYLADNKLQGPLPISLFSTDKSRIDLSSNAFQGPLPLLGNLSSLVALHLGVNNLSSTTQLNGLVMDSLTNCTHLELLYLNSNQLAGDFPTSVANLSTGLLEFCIDDNMFTGTFPRGLDSYQNLTALAIQKNMFTGTIPSTLGKLRKMQKLSLQENMFSGEIPDMFEKLTQLFQLTMGGNRFSGRIPPSLAKCERLGTLGLPGNNLSGGIPKEIFGLSNLRTLQLARNNLTDTLPEEVGNLKQLETMSLQDNQLLGNIPTSIGGCTSLRILNMARNKLNGSIPTSFRDLKGLESLDLSSNSLSGPILQDFGNLTTLLNLNLSFNKLEGEVPGYGVFLTLTSDSLEGNDKLCSTDKDIARKLRIVKCDNKKRIASGLLIKVLVPLCTFIVLVFVASFSYLAWSAKRRRKEEPRDLEDVSSLPTSNIALPKISYSELRVATNEFAESNLIGKGAFGSVYKAVLTKEGQATSVAVKVLDLLGQSKASKSFDVECQALRNVRHRNLVKVLTSCSSTDRSGGEFKALVMELMSNGNLDKWLYEACDLNVWQRLDIAIDVASAIDYLHHGCDPPVVHCDLKPANVLLDDDMTAHVGDFGLARFLTEEEVQKGSSTAGLKGSIGYIPPEYGVSGKVSTSGDVYSFGILVLEMFIAKKPTDEMFEDGSSLVEFASAAITSGNIVDPTLIQSIGCDNDNVSNIVEECVEAVVRVGLCCASHSPKDRLSIREALTLLNAIRKRHNPNKAH